jgi:hypothetical protein
MADVKELGAKVADEFADAMEYAKMALEYKKTDPDLSRMLFEISGQEMQHMNKLHKALTTKIEETQTKYQEA